MMKTTMTMMARIMAVAAFALVWGGDDPMTAVYAATVRGRPAVDTAIVDRHYSATSAQPNRRRLQVTSRLDLINAATETKIVTLSNERVIAVNDIAGLTMPNFNINATFASSSNIQYVVFGYNDNPSVRTDSVAPYSLCGNQGPLYNTCDQSLGYGTHTVTATPYTSESVAAGPTISVTFTIVQFATVAPTLAPITPVPKLVPTAAPVVVATSGIVGLQLVYTGTPAPHAFIQNLTLGSSSSNSNNINVVDLAVLNVSMAAFNLNLPRDVGKNVTVVQSVRFSNGQEESGAYLAYCGNSGLNFATCSDLVVGANVTIVIAPYPLHNQQGQPLPKLSTTIQIIDSRNGTGGGSGGGTPTKAPVKAPTAAPVAAPPMACTIPKLQGTSWQKGQAYPLNVAEAQGAMVETKLVLMSGFFGSWSATTPEAYALDTALSNSAPAAVAASWQRLDDQLASPSLTHAPVVAIGTKLYMCGGYKGGGEGPTTNTCLVLDISKPNGQQWSMFAPLPGIGHAGGGMVYDKTLNALFYAGGALRIKGKKTVDLNNTWMYSFDKSTAGWVARAPIPFKANHMSSTTAKDGSGVEHHFFVGGQEAENEAYGNVVHHYEYDAINDQWLPRQSLPYPRGHASASTIPFGCGYLVIGGTTNGWQRTPDVTYYDIATDAWTKIGELPFGINTPICDINRVTNMLYCESGGLNFAFSWKRQLLIA